MVSLQHVLVTGGAGFIGSHSARALLERGVRVRVLDDFSTGLKSNLDGLELELIEGDLCDEQLLARSLSGVDAVLHLAALPSVARSIAHPLESHRVNATGTLLLLEQARQRGVERVVMASSSSVYGDQQADVKSELLAPCPLSPYAVSKLAAESYGRSYASVHGMETVALRYFNVFGPGQRADSPYAAVIASFVDRLRQGQPLRVHGDGEQTRDFTYVDNAVDANLRALERPGVGGAVLNVATGRSASVNRLVEILGGLCGRRPELEHVEPRSGDVRHSLADVSRARELLGYQPLVSLEQGLEKLWRLGQGGAG